LAELIWERFGKRYHPSSLSKILRRMGFSRQKTRPSHPKSDPKPQAAWVKRGSLTH
jgi:transposase